MRFGEQGLPDSNAFLRHGEKLATADQERAFWTTRRLAVAEQAYVGVGRQLQELYGGSEVPEFSRDMFVLVAVEDEEKIQRSGGYDSDAGKIILEISQVDVERVLAYVVAFEVGVMMSAGLSESMPELEIVDAAVIELTTSELLHKILPRVKLSSEPVGYSRAVGAVTTMYRHMYLDLPEDRFKYAEDVLELLKQAVFKGKWQVFFDTFEEVYGGVESWDQLRQLAVFCRRGGQ